MNGYWNIKAARAGTPSWKWKLLAFGLPALILAEQLAKFLAVDRLTTVFARAADHSFYEKLRVFYGYRHLEPLALEPYEVWKGFWRMTYAENPGSAFGLLGTMTPSLRLALFTMITVAAVAFIIGAYRRLSEDQRVRQIALMLVLAGAIGNFTDRLARGYVVDFIDWGFRDMRWPTFNLADVFLVVGMGLLFLADGRSVEPRASEPGAADRMRTLERDPERTGT